MVKTYAARGTRKNSSETIFHGRYRNAPDKLAALKAPIDPQPIEADLHPCAKSFCDLYCRPWSKASGNERTGQHALQGSLIDLPYTKFSCSLKEAL